MSLQETIETYFSFIKLETEVIYLEIVAEGKCFRRLPVHCFKTFHTCSEPVGIQIDQF